MMDERKPIERRPPKPTKDEALRDLYVELTATVRILKQTLQAASLKLLEEK